MDLKLAYKVGDKIICRTTWKVYKVKYILTNKLIVNNGDYDFPFYESEVVLWTPLMEELL